ncbi:GNAT family N-acetyltransferase [Brachybacterium halotolerans subsp. kimchii]|uniref:GNAT family N-acetyltransferase n=1 Tax=Brachybacterium halotolerans TaxID=2795215 RepID=UPI001E55CB97|nr:GNAT family N-acetyltransferase [Brachybacterium halotolerans]UEJ82906.1 GNAT family N-acetyltransferase [Brachybacterium halotolerans subsp. kimchii]
MDETVRIREARREDLATLEAIGAEGDAMFAGLFGPEPFGPDSAESGEARAAEPGIVLVAVVGAAADERVAGFAHVLEIDGATARGDRAEAHLEQLAVLPAFGRRGIGRALVEASYTWAAGRGHMRITLRTYAEVPWNAPFYARCGFRVVDPTVGGGDFDTAFQRGLVETERGAGLGRHGRRVLMVRDVGPAASSATRACSCAPGPCR